MWLSARGAIWERKLNVEIPSVLFGNLIMQRNYNSKHLTYVYRMIWMKSNQGSIYIKPMVLLWWLPILRYKGHFQPFLLSSHLQTFACRSLQCFGFTFCFAKDTEAIKWQLFHLPSLITPLISVPIVLTKNKKLSFNNHLRLIVPPSF